MSGSGGAPVYIAAQFGNVQVLRLLLEAGSCQHYADTGYGQLWGAML